MSTVTIAVDLAKNVFEIAVAGRAGRRSWPSTGSAPNGSRLVRRGSTACGRCCGSSASPCRWDRSAS
jgi:hypothetical protein